MTHVFFWAFTINCFAAAVCGAAAVVNVWGYESPWQLSAIVAQGFLALGNGLLAVSNWRKWRKAVNEYYDKTLDGIAAVGRNDYED